MRKMIKKSFEARAKINLGLEILFRRADGFHEIKSIMQNVRLSDTLSVEIADGEGIELKTLGAGNIKTEDNLVFRAAELFLKESGEKFALKMLLDKRIPQMAGLGGGSSDAACALKALNELRGFPLSEKKLFSLAAQLGSDIPFFLGEGAALASGRGEILERLEPMPEFFVLIAIPAFRSDTGELYSRFKTAEIREKINTDALFCFLKERRYREFFSSMKNRFEDLLGADERAEVSRLKESLLCPGALGASLSGSGSAVFGIYETEEQADAAYKALEGRVSELYSTSFYTNNI